MTILLANASSGFTRDDDSSSFVLVVGSRMSVSSSKFNGFYDGFASLKVAHVRREEET